MIVQIFPNKIEITAQTKEEWDIIESDNPFTVAGSDKIEITHIWYGDTARLDIMGQGLIIKWKRRE